MKIFKVNSLPLKEVIENLATSFNVRHKENCEEYHLNIPSDIGIGQIRGVNFDNGLGFILYECQFNDDVRIDFTIDDVHPVKFIYSAQGTLHHSFANDKDLHNIEQYKCAIVASKKTNGHILNFVKNEKYKIVSLEIDREQFSKSSSCEIKGESNELQALFSDVKADTLFYHDGFYGIEFKEIFNEVSKFEDQILMRKFHLETIALRIFINQLIQYDDDLNDDEKSTLVRVKELNKVEELTGFIKENLDHDLTIQALAKKTGLNPNKLQSAFKYLYHTTVNEYVTKARLEKSKRLLLDRNLNISDIVSLVGLESKSYFSKIFKREFEMSPSEYRNLMN
jgi:AraC-like DNA-binding protein